MAGARVIELIGLWLALIVFFSDSLFFFVSLSLLMRRPLLRVATFLDPVRYADGLLLLEGLAAARVAGTVPDTVLVLEVKRWAKGQFSAGRLSLFNPSALHPHSHGPPHALP